MQLEEIVAELQSHVDVMYRELEPESEKRLRTGDVVRLELEDFKKILKNFELLEPLLRSYDQNPKYNSKLWAILNKPCDMVHDGSQKFKSSSLFLTPLQSFIGELRKDRIFGEYVLPPLAVATIQEALEDIAREYFKSQSNILFACNANDHIDIKKKVSQDRKDHQKSHITWVVDEIINKYDVNEVPETTEKTLLKFSETLTQPRLSNIRQFLIDLPSLQKWIDYKKNYNQSVKENNQVRLDPKTLTEMSKNIFVNQMEIRGRFYYEPHLKLYSKEVNDFSYVIELEDMMTLKVNEAAIEDGSLVQLLKDKRLVGLTRNYSDRLQNIMGYYYAKIGTADVQSKVVLSLYDKCFDNFFSA